MNSMLWVLMAQLHPFLHFGILMFCRVFVKLIFDHRVYKSSGLEKVFQDMADFRVRDAFFDDVHLAILFLNIGDLIFNCLYVKLFGYD